MTTEEKHKGGRPPKTQVKQELRGIMKEVKIADVNLVKNMYIKQTGQKANYHTIKKYLDVLKEEDFLRCNVVSSNIEKFQLGERKLPRQIFVYKINGI